MRKRAYPTFLQSKQDLPDVTELGLPDELDCFVSSRDGNLIFYRGVERESYRAKLVLIDRRDPSSAHAKPRSASRSARRGASSRCTISPKARLSPSLAPSPASVSV